jgi:integrase
LPKLAGVIEKLGTTPTGLTEKNRGLVRQFDDPKLRAALFNLPGVLVGQLATARLSPERRLQKIRTAFAIALLVRIPLRIQNLSTLRLHHELQWPNGRAGAVFVTFRDADTKNTQPLDYEIAGRARDLLHDYLDRYRVHFADSGNPWLFVHADGTAVSATTLRDGITKAIKRELGIHMTPHQFRHVAAAIALDAQPGAINLVKGLLGHKNIKTTLNSYAGMRTREAGRAYDEILAKSQLATSTR